MNKLHIYRCWLAFGLALSLLFAGGEKASALMRKIGLDALAAEAEVIFVGQVSEIQSYWNQDKTFIYTDVKLDVEDSIKGQAGMKSFVVTQPGGVVGNKGLKVSDVPNFTLGEEVLVFLGRAEERTAGEAGETGWKVLGGGQGKMRLMKDQVSGQRRILLERTTVWDEGKIVEQKEREIPWEEFRAKLKKMLD